MSSISSISINNNDQQEQQQQQQQQPQEDDAAATSEQITHVLNREKKCLSEHGQKLFNAINVLLDDDEQLELTQALFKYQREHNVFTLVRSCRELFDSTRKKSLMLFMRPVIPVRDRFHYDEYYKLFFPEEFAADVRSIFGELIPRELIERSMRKALDKKRSAIERELTREQAERAKTVDILNKANIDLNVDLERLVAAAKSIALDPALALAEASLAATDDTAAAAAVATKNTESNSETNAATTENRFVHNLHTTCKNNYLVS